MVIPANDDEPLLTLTKAVEAAVAKVRGMSEGEWRALRLRPVLVEIRSGPTEKPQS